MNRNQWVAAAGALLTIASTGCTSYVTLLEPRDDDKITGLHGTASPPFSWKIDLQTPLKVEYKLTVKSQGETIFTKQRIPDRQFQIQPGDGWLPGDRSYEWTVEGQTVNEEGQVVDVLPCKMSRRFTIEKRPTVVIQFSAPTFVEKPAAAAAATGEGEGEGAAPAPVEEKKPVKVEVEFMVGDESAKGDFEVPMEVGEVRSVSLRATRDKRTISVGGTITVLQANENTKLGKVLVNDLQWDELVRIAEKGDVGEHRYMLGGEEIARLKLGSRG